MEAIASGRLVCFVDSSFILANARVVDHPIVFCNDGFVKLSGFSKVEAMQRPALCPFMHGDLTNGDTLGRLENAFENFEQEQVEILLYKKGSASFIYMYIYTRESDLL